MNRAPFSKQLIILGFGGHARSVADVALATGYESLVFVDEHARDGEMFLGFPVLKCFEPQDPKTWCAFAASGNGLVRKSQAETIKENNWNLISLIAPSATRGVGSSVAECVFVGHHAHIGPMAMVGMGSIVNSGAVVEHECMVGEWAHVSVNATMAGRSKIGAFSMLGAGATIIDSVEISNQITIGAGAVVHKSINEAGVYIGIPASRLDR
ncbi:NeuD/PglB/VioB family sugar acetyltransferase [Hydrogenophaga sp.]|uniref:NeuD/PglB/VioB family sugar acetyltransferase n=1 Tax=Hydrogenophaga sp. TaxID=1904254 RepID=UPI003F6B3117